jgi:hypothetical protein
VVTRYGLLAVDVDDLSSAGLHSPHASALQPENRPRKTAASVTNNGSNQYIVPIGAVLLLNL